MDNLFPEGYEDEVITEEEVTKEKAVGYRPSVGFDFYKGDFIRDGRHRMVSVPGVESAKQWCMKETMTERKKHLAYSSDRGIDVDAVFAADTREMAESILFREISEALLSDPYERVMYVPEIETNWTAPDTLSVHVTVVLIYDVTIDFDVEIMKAG